MQTAGSIKCCLRSAFTSWSVDSDFSAHCELAAEANLPNVDVPRRIFCSAKPSSLLAATSCTIMQLLQPPHALKCTLPTRAVKGLPKTPDGVRRAGPTQTDKHELYCLLASRLVIRRKGGTRPMMSQEQNDL